MKKRDSHQATPTKPDENMRVKALHLLQSDAPDTCGFALEWLVQVDDAQVTPQ